MKGKGKGKSKASSKASAEKHKTKHIVDDKEDTPEITQPSRRVLAKARLEARAALPAPSMDTACTPAISPGEPPVIVPEALCSGVVGSVDCKQSQHSASGVSPETTVVPVQIPADSASSDTQANVTNNGEQAFIALHAILQLPQFVAQSMPISTMLGPEKLLAEKDAEILALRQELSSASMQLAAASKPLQVEEPSGCEEHYSAAAVSSLSEEFEQAVALASDLEFRCEQLCDEKAQLTVAMHAQNEAHVSETEQLTQCLQLEILSCSAVKCAHELSEMQFAQSKFSDQQVQRQRDALNSLQSHLKQQQGKVMPFLKK